MDHPVRRASLLQEPFSEELRAARDALYTIGETSVDELLESELADIDPGQRGVMVSAVATVLEWGMWNDLRQTGRTVPEAKAAVLLAVKSILGR